jgi:tetratricopeptide (TPR) repeat protein
MAKSAMKRRFNWKLAVLLLVIVGCLAGAGYLGRNWLKAYRAQQALTRGLAAYEAKNWTAAASDLGRYLSAHGDDVAVLLKYAEAQLRLRPQKPGHVQQAVSAYRVILRQDPSHRDATHRLAQVYLSGGAPGDAEMVLRPRLAADERDTMARLLLASALAQTRKFSEAAAAAAKVIAIAPDDAAGYTLLLSLARQRPQDVTEKPEDLIQRLEAAQAAHPTSESLGLYVAARRIAERKYDDARAILARLDPASPGVREAQIDLAMREGRTEAALDLADQFVAAAGDVRAHAVRGRVRAALNQLDHAQADYEKITELQPDEAGSWLVLGGFLAQRGKLPEALKAVEQALAVEPNSPAAVVLAASLYGRSDDPAVRAKIDPLLDAATEANPGNLGLRVVKAQRVLLRMTPAALKEARQMLDEVTRKDPTLVNAWGLSAQVALLQNLPQSALDAIGNGLAAAQNDQDRLQLLALRAQAEEVQWPALAAATRRQIADTYRAAWERARTDLRAGVALVNAYVELNEAAKALPVLQELRPRAATDIDRLQLDILTANAVGRSGDYPKGIELAQTLRTQNPDRPELVLLTGDLMARAGRWTDLKPLAAEWQKAHPRDAATAIRLSQLLLTHAETLLAQSPPDADGAARSRTASQDVLRVALQENPDHLDLKAQLATALHQAGQLDEAEALFKAVLAKSPEHLVAVNNFAWLLCEDRGKPEEALALANRGFARWPRFPSLLDTRGRILHALKRTDEARQSFEEALRLAPAGSSAHPYAAFHLGQLLAELGDKERAALYLTVALTPTGGAALDAKDRDQALKLLASLRP